MAGAKPLNERQKRFVQEYLIDLNGTQAAIRAGYSPKTAAEQSYDLLRNPQIKAAIAEAEAARSARTGITGDRTLQEAARVAFYDPRKLMKKTARGYDLKTLAELDDDTAAAIASVKISADGSIEYKAWDKNAALEKLFRHLSLYKESEERSNPGGGIASLLNALQGAVMPVAKAPPGDQP